MAQIFTPSFDTYVRLGFVVAGLLWAAAANAQVATGTISGTVTDPSGAVIEAAQITITNVATGDVRAATSNPTGEFQVPELPIGVYHVRVRHPGFKESVVTGVELHVDSTAIVNATTSSTALPNCIPVSSNSLQ